MPKLVHITTVPESLGFVAGQIDWLKTRGWEVHAISSPGDLLDRFGAQHDIPVYGVPMARAITPFADMRSIGEVSRLLTRLAPDIVHSHTPKGGMIGMMAARAAHVPHKVYQMRGLLTLTASGKRKALLAAAETMTCGLADVVICQSRSLRKIAVDEGLVESARATVLLSGSNGVDSERFDATKFDRDALRESHGIPQDAVVAGFVGRLVGDKGIVELAEAWSRVSNRLPNAHLLVVGPFEERDPVPAKTRRQLENDPRVHMVGFTHDTAPFYAMMDVLMLPSYREGFPNVPLEAAAMGLPVIATDVIGCIDAVQHGVTGTLVPPRDTQLLEFALEDYLSDPELRRRHGDAGRARILRDFAPENIWEAGLQLYQSLLHQ
jgi:glycosyltransferase involved in cell wall biosynthesis